MSPVAEIRLKRDGLRDSVPLLSRISSRSKGLKMRINSTQTTRTGRFSLRNHTPMCARARVYTHISVPPYQNKEKNNDINN